MSDKVKDISSRIEDNNSDDEEDMDADDWEELEDNVEEDPPLHCLFEKKKHCELTFTSFEKAILHLKHAHNLDFLELKLVHKMDCYSFIKLINFIRKHDLSPEDILQQIAEASDIANFPWSADDYMKPHLSDDCWLMYDYDDIEEAVEECVPLKSVHHVNVEHGRITMTEKHYASLQEQIKTLTQQLAEKSREIEMRNEDMTEMRRLLNGMLDQHKHGEDSEDTRSRHHDKYYFNSYEDAHIHAEMIKDSVRTESYKKAILDNKELFTNARVLDVGAGTGILSIFAAQAGAAKVYAVEKSDIAYETIEIIRKNNYSEKVEVLHKLVEDVEELAVEKVDVIISEWMGYFLLFETMIDSVIHARDRFLKPGGVLCPNRFTLSLCAASEPDLYNNLITFWDNVHGIDMHVMTRLIYSDVQLLIIKPETIMTSSSQLACIDLMHSATNSSCVNFSSPFRLQATQDSVLNCFVAYFDTFFDLKHPVEFSTGSHAQPTHWKQSVFLLKKPVQIKKDEILEGTLTCERMQSDSRSLNISITFKDTTQDYQLQ